MIRVVSNIYADEEATSCRNFVIAPGLALATAMLLAGRPLPARNTLEYSSFRNCQDQMVGSVVITIASGDYVHSARSS